MKTTILSLLICFSFISKACDFNIDEVVLHKSGYFLRKAVIVDIDPNCSIKTSRTNDMYIKQSIVKKYEEAKYYTINPLIGEKKSFHIEEEIIFNFGRSTGKSKINDISSNGFVQIASLGDIYVDASILEEYESVAEYTVTYLIGKSKTFTIDEMVSYKEGRYLVKSRILDITSNGLAKTSHSGSKYIKLYKMKHL